MIDRKVLIVGGGLAGSLLASTLLRKGADVDLVEKTPLFKHDDGAGLLLTGNGTNMLRALGRSDVEAHGRSITHVDLHADHGQQIGRIECQGEFLSFQYAVLRAALADKAPVRHAMTVKRIDFGSRAHVAFADGSHQKYDLVIGADGVHSKVRELLFGTASQQEMSQYTGYRFLIPTPPGLSQAATFLGNGLTLLLVPLPGGVTYCGAGPISSERLQPGGSTARKIRNSYKGFQGAAADALAFITADTRFIPSRFWVVKTQRWSNGPCVLIGDAAHAMPPTLSQGTAMAFEDIFVLISCLDDHSDITDALLEFHVRRQARVDLVQAESIARMQANRNVDKHASQMRQKISSSLGAMATQKLWTKLVEERP